MTSEAHICAQIADYLRARFGRRAYWFRPHGHLGQRAGVPDFVGWIDGRGFGIEVKGPKGKVSLKQQAELEAGAEAGGIAFVARSLDDVMERFEEEGLA